MRVIFLRKVNVSKVSVAIMVLILLVGLISSVIYISNNNFSNLLMISPQNTSEVNIDIKDLEKLNEKNVMLTYQSVEDDNIVINKTRHNIKVKGTNYCYMFVLGHTLKSGGFFTNKSQDNKKKVVVLNELAAYSMFGSNNIIGNTVQFKNQTYEIVGVISDKDDKSKNVYIPITLLDKKPQIVYTVIDDKQGASKEVIINDFKKLGITTDNYLFNNFIAVNRVVKQRLIVAVGLLVCIMLVVCLCRRLKKLKYYVCYIKNELKACYIKHIIINHKMTIVKGSYELVLTGLISSVLYMIMSKMIAIIVGWYCSKDILVGQASMYSKNVDFFLNLNMISNVLFLLIVALYIIILTWFLRNKNNYKDKMVH